MLNIPDLTIKWGHIFGGVNQFDTFRGTTTYARADLIASTYTTAAEQRLAAEGLYDQMSNVDTSLDSVDTYFFGLAKDTLKIAAIADSSYPIATDDDSLLTKLLADMVAQAATFQLPTTTIGGSAVSANATGVTTLQGAPFGTGVIVGAIIEPRTGVVKYYSFAETISLICTVDSYTGGATAGQESFSLQTFSAVDAVNSQWPKGSGVNTTVQSSPSSRSTLIGNAYFDNWSTSVPNTPLSWTVNVLVPGVTLFQSTDAYVGLYSAKFTAALINSELTQPIVGLQGNTNYLVAIRMKRVTVTTGGVITVALRDQFGAIITNALGANLSFTVNIAGAIGAFILTDAVFSVPRGFATIPNLSIKFTTAMNAAETIELATVELIPMTSTYVGGPDIGFLPGNVGWAKNDAYTLAVANTGGKTTFVGNINRLYDTAARGVDLPVNAIPTVSDAIIV